MAYGSTRSISDSILEATDGESIQEQIDAYMQTAASGTKGEGLIAAANINKDTGDAVSDMRRKSLGARKETATVQKASVTDKLASVGRDWMALLKGVEEVDAPTNVTLRSDIMAASSTGATTVNPIKSLLDFIGDGEGDYDSSNSGTNSKGEIVHYSHSTVRDGKKLSNMTIAEVRPFQAITDPEDANRLFTVGKYQMVPDTFDIAVEGLGFSEDTVLTSEVQDQMGIYLVSKKPGRSRLSGFLTGNTDISSDAAMLDLAMEFASVPVPFAIKKGKYGSWPKRDIAAGESFYADPKAKLGGNNAAHTVAQTQTILNGVRGALTSNQAPDRSLRPVNRGLMTSPRPQARP
tara:strand:+ start:3386 stop:4432 length:1047 start_codon:yes stop_codon:yes gene_type:complete